MKVFFTTLFITLFCIGFAQPLPEWSSSIYTNFSHYFNDNPSVKLDNAGNLVLVANSSSVNEDILIVKYSPSGNIIWQQIVNDTLQTRANDFIIDGEDNIYVIGSGYVDTSAAAMVLKYRTDGSLVWKNTYDSNVGFSDVYNAGTLGSVKNIYVTGYSVIDTMFNSKLLVAEIDSFGNTLWTTFYGENSTLGYRGEKIAIVGNKLYVVSDIRYEPGFPVLTIDLAGSIVHSHTDESLIRPASCFHQDRIGNTFIGFGTWERYKLVKINSMGNIVWQDTVDSHMSSASTGDELLAIATDSLGNVYSTGRYYQAGCMSILTVKYLPNGQKQWVRKYENVTGSGFQAGRAIVLDRQLNVYVAGYGGNSSGTYDYIVVKYDNNGNLIGDIRYGNPINTNDAISSIAVGNNGEMYVTGLTFDTVRSFTTTQKYSSVNPVGIIEINREYFQSQVFPNPFNQQATVSLLNPTNDSFEFQLYDAQGKMLIARTMQEDAITIDLSNLTSGYYTYTLHSVQQYSFGKLVKLQ